MTGPEAGEVPAGLRERLENAPRGGAFSSLADAAFSVACSSHGEPAVALSVTTEDGGLVALAQCVAHRVAR